MTGPYNKSPLLDGRVRQPAVVSPQVTVVVTNFNYARFIHSCLESIAGQSYRNFKCVVVDDCSTDDSVTIIEEFIHSPSAEGKFSLVRHEKNSGQMAGFRTGLKHAVGPFLVYVDADDLLLEDFLDAHLHAHTSHEPVAFTSSDQYQINDKGEIIAGTHSDHKAKGRFSYVLSQPLHQPYWVWATTSSMMFRTSVLELVLPDQDDNYRICADNYMCHFANLIGNSLLIPMVHGCYRRHGSNHFSSNQMVGGAHPTGDMKQHPKDHVVRLNIFTTLCSREQDFKPLLTSSGLAKRLAYTAGPIEIVKFLRLLPKHSPLLRMLLYCIYLRILLVAKRFLVLSKGKQMDFQFGKNCSVLEIPGR